VTSSPGRAARLGIRCHSSEDALHRVHGFEGSGAAHQRAGGETVPGQMWIKRTVLEMGGKDGIVVDEEADIDAAVEGTVQAAFGYQGQKCSDVRAPSSPKDLRHFRDSWWAHEENHCRAERQSEQLHGPGGQPVGDERRFWITSK